MAIKIYATDGTDLDDVFELAPTTGTSAFERIRLGNAPNLPPDGDRWLRGGYVRGSNNQDIFDRYASKEYGSGTSKTVPIYITLDAADTYFKKNGLSEDFLATSYLAAKGTCNFNPPSYSPSSATTNHSVTVPSSSSITTGTTIYYTPSISYNAAFGSPTYSIVSYTQPTRTSGSSSVACYMGNPTINSSGRISRTWQGAWTGGAGSGSAYFTANVVVKATNTFGDSNYFTLTTSCYVSVRYRSGGGGPGL